jgi:hypothetical protein
MAWIALIMVAIGVPLLWIGIRGRRIDTCPLCRWCGFDLTGIYPDAKLCTECGAGLYAKRGPKPVRLGRRKRRWPSVFVGALLTLAGSAQLGLFVTGGLRTMNLLPLTPSWIVQSRALNPDAAIADPALAELSSRFAAGSLSTGRIRILADRALDVQADRTRPWYGSSPTNPGWADLFEAALKSRALSPAQLQRFASGAQFVELVVPTAARRGHTWTLGIRESQTRIGPSRPFAYSMQFTRVTLDGKVVVDRPADPGRAAAGGGGMSPGNDPWVPVSESFDADPGHDGPVEVEAIVQLWLFDGPGGTRGVPIMGSWPVTLHAQVRAVAADTQIVQLAVDPALRQRVQAALVPRVPIRNILEPRSAYTWSAIDVDNLPIPLAFEIFLRAGAREWPVGTLIAPKGDRSVHSYGGREFPLTGLDALQVDLILRPSRAAAERIPGGVDEIWGEEIVIPNLAVQAIDNRVPQR